MEKKAPPEPVADPRIKMHNLGTPQKGTVVSAKIAAKKFDDRHILKDLEVKVASGERVLIRGANGTGKTTLLNIMAGHDKDFDGQIVQRSEIKLGYLRQFSDLDAENTVLDEFGKRTEIDYTQRRNILASYLFPAEFMEEKIGNLSYGQQRRLELAIMLTNKPDVIFLDEPTNHLDIFLREDLERFLVEQEIAMCIISHVQYFIDRIGITRVIELG